MLLQPISSNDLPPYSDKVILPQSVLQEILEADDEPPYPLIFRVGSHLVGVREFSGGDGKLVLPRHLYNIMGGDEVSVELARDVPKATSLRITPAHYYAEVDNWKFFLEDKLNKFYTCVAPGPLYIMDQGLRYEVMVEEVNGGNQPACVIDTDVVLDVVPLDDTNAARQIKDTEKNPYNRIVSLEKEITLVDYKPFTDPSFVPTILRVDASQYSRMQVQANGADVLVGLDMFVNMDAFRNASFEADKDSVVVNMKDDDIVSKMGRDNEKWVYVVPIVWEQTPRVVVSVNEDEGEQGTPMSSPEDTPSSTMCVHCHIGLPESKVALHEAFCIRNNVKCHCGRVFLREIPDSHKHCECGFTTDSPLDHFKHQKFMHSGPYVCLCSASFTNYFDLAHHRAGECPEKLHQCRFCHLTVPQGMATYQDKMENLTNHENMCGNKTTECYECSRPVRVKDVPKHLSAHELRKAEARNLAIANACANQNCTNQANGNLLGLCDLCFGPLYVPQLDPRNSKLQARIERRYMMQLTKGCRNAWCNNKYCASSNACDPSVKGASMSELGTVLQILYRNIVSPSLPVNVGKTLAHKNSFWFCVGESVSRRKSMKESGIA